MIVPFKLRLKLFFLDPLNVYTAICCTQGLWLFAIVHYAYRREYWLALAQIAALAINSISLHRMRIVLVSEIWRRAWIAYTNESMVKMNKQRAADNPGNEGTKPD